MRPNRRTTRKPSAKFFIFIGGVAVAVFFVVFFIFQVNTVQIQTGKIDFDTSQATVIVRDEQVFNAENYGKATFLASEGERVTEGTEIAEVYKWGYNDKIMSELLETQTKIEQYQENNLLRDVIDQDLAAINQSISDKSEQISDIISGKAEGDLIEEEKALRLLMENKQQYLHEKVNADTQLNQYYEQESQLIERVDSWRETVTAPEAGVVSFYFDGCEDLLNANNIEQLTIKNINDIVNGSALTQAVTSEAERPLYRLVNNYKWYLLIVSTVPIHEFESDNDFYIAFKDYVDKQYTGKVVGKREEESGYIYAIEIDDDIGPLLNTRRTDADIHAVFQGLKVPSKSIKTVENVKGVYLIENKEKKFVPVNVLIDKGGYAIIKPVNENDKLQSGQEIEE
jgi:putative membrane fusion protein